MGIDEHQLLEWLGRGSSSRPKTQAETVLARQSVVFSNLQAILASFSIHATLGNWYAETPVFADLLSNKALAIELLYLKIRSCQATPPALSFHISMRAKKFYLHTSNRIELLAKQLAFVAQEHPLPGPLDQESVMTLNTGMAKWLRFEIARNTSIAFGWEFPFPNLLFKRIAAGFESRFADCVDYDEARAQ